MNELRASWASDGITDLGGQAPEAAEVARALVADHVPKLGGVPLCSVIRFDGRRIEEYLKAAEALLEGGMPRTGDARTLIAAAGYAYALDPGVYQARDVPAQVLHRMRAIQ